MIIGTTQTLLKCKNLNIDLNGVGIEFVKQPKLLGVYINWTLSWDAHVEFVSKKIIRKLAILKRVSYLMPSNALLKIYSSIVFSHFTYCCTVWSNVKNPFYLEKVFKLQKKGSKDF
jgi:hypothetical protein